MSKPHLSAPVQGSAGYQHASMSTHDAALVAPIAAPAFAAVTDTVAPTCLSTPPMSTHGAFLVAPPSSPPPPSPPPPLPPCRTPVVAVRPCCTPAARPYGVRPCHREWLRHRPPRYMQIPGYSSATSRFQESKCADSRILFRTFQFPSFRVSYFRSCTHSFDSLFIHMRCQARQLAQIFNSSTLLSISTADRTHARTGPDTDTQRASLLGE